MIAVHSSTRRAALVHLSFAITVLAVSQDAHAWDAPLCALDETLATPTTPIEVEPEPVMCSEDAHHLVPEGRPSDTTMDDAAARRAYERARELAASGRPRLAILELRTIDEAFPEISDRTALFRGDLLIQSGQPRLACDAYDVAVHSPDTAVAARARVGRVRCKIHSGHRDAAADLTALIRRYPELPEALHLRLELAQHYESTGDTTNAVRIYRDIDLMRPGSPVAERARARLGALADTGAAVRELTTIQEVDRAERLAQQGPMDMARAEVDRLFETRLPNDLRARLALAGARIARIEGRWDDARRYVAIARSGGATVDEESSEIERAQHAAAAASAREQEVAQSQIDRLRGRRPWARVPHLQLRNIVDIAARAGLTEPLNEALRVLAGSRRLHPAIAFDAGVLASGIGDDDLVARVFASLRNNPRYAVEAKYHYARALERLGRWVEAERELLEVIERDRSETRWYAMWSQQRLWAVREAMLCDCGPEEMRQRALARERLRARATGEPVVLASLHALADPAAPAPEPGAYEGKVAPGEIPPLETSARPDLDALRARLEPIAEQHGEAYPWLPRAVSLLRLGDTAAAADELHEAYIAYRDAAGRGIRRVGLEAVYRGAERPRYGVDWQTRRKRRSLGYAQRRELGEIASVLGDEGTAAGFIGWERVRARPRAFEPIVREVAERHGLDPNLLLAVMRVESVYQPRIVSYAGAVGLMQIMPRTGRLIAEALERDDYTTADLLDPETNLEFAAWYLASLIERWDGHLPLAIASYNGGPHNVRRWLRDHGENMALDAFLERIPFTQTHRYVRRVLTHYAEYRAQQGLPMERLSTYLPEAGTDPVGF